MQIVIIAGGEGKRMKPLTTHKSLYQFLGKPLVAHLIPHLNLKENKILIVTSPASLSAFKSDLVGYKVEYVVQPVPNGMAGALIAAESVLDTDSPILVVSAAKIQSSDTYSLMLDAINQNPSSPLLVSRKVTKYKDGGYLKLAGDKVVAIIEKPGEKNMPSDLYKLILDYFPKSGEFIDYLKTAKTDKDDVYEVALTNYLQDHSAHNLIVSAAHVSIKHAYNLLDVMHMTLTDLLKPSIAKSTQIAASAVISGNVMIDEGAKILENAVIKGPAYIGKNVVIGNGTLVRESCIEEGSQIGYGSEIARSYMGPYTKGHMMYVGDSIIEGHVNFSAGTVLANYRFDHDIVSLDMPAGKVSTGRAKFGSIIAKGTITGVNTSLMPGTVVGANVTIGSGCVVKGNIPDNSIIKPIISTYEK